jgi:hypothetical protein
MAMPLDLFFPGRKGASSCRQAVSARYLRTRPFFALVGLAAEKPRARSGIYRFSRHDNLEA